MRGCLAPAVVAASLLIGVSPAVAADPIMPLSEVRAGMACTGYSVVRGTEVSSFDVEILDVVDGDGSSSGPRILFRVSGPAVDETGIGPGFSGSPIYCDSGDGVRRNAGAISESVGEYGGKVALATPIESILGVPVDQPSPTTKRSRSLGRTRPLAAPLSVSGLSSGLARALVDAGERAGRPVLAAPAAPLAPYPVVDLKPGSAVAAGYSAGDLTVSAIGTVAYTDGDQVWAFGHALDGVGARSLFLQDAYVYRVINNPNALGDFGTTYKLSTGGHPVGTLTSDGLSAIAGRKGAVAPSIPIKVIARDLDRGTAQVLDTVAADETDAGNPSGFSAAGFVAPLAVAQAVDKVLGSAPLRSAGTACLELRFVELPDPVRFCNRYVGATADGVVPGFGTVVAARAASDLSDALSQIDLYRFAPPHLTSIRVELGVRRGSHQAFLRSVTLPRTVRRGRTYTLRARLLRIGGGAERRRYRVTIPQRMPLGRRKVAFLGIDSDFAEGDLFGDLIIEFGDEGEATGRSGPTSHKALAASIERLRVWDGVRMKAGRLRVKGFRDRDLRISGKAAATLRVKR
jgi:hypothetical protein